jgi:hypothetical protein
VIDLTLSKILAILTAFFLLVPALAVEPLPKELEEAYKKFREFSAGEMGVNTTNISEIDPGAYSLEWITPVMKDMTYHDAGLGMGVYAGVNVSRSTKLASNYLKRNVLERLKSAYPREFEDRDRLLELLFYYVRDEIRMAGPEDIPEEERLLANAPGVGGTLYISKERVLQFPAETVALEVTGVCYDKCMLLGALLKLSGYEVAYGYYPAAVFNFGPIKREFGGYHSYVLVKSDRGDWTIEGEKDIYGNPMDGKWMVLDTLYSPSHAPKMGFKPVGFGETPPWAGRLIKDQKGKKVLPPNLAALV